MSENPRYPYIEVDLPKYEGIYDDDYGRPIELYITEPERKAIRIAELILLSVLAFFLAFGIVCLAARAIDQQAKIQQEEIYSLSAEMEELSQHDLNP